MSNLNMFSYDETLNTCVVLHLPADRDLCSWRAVTTNRADAKYVAGAHFRSKHKAQDDGDWAARLTENATRVLDVFKAWSTRDPDIQWLYSKPDEVRVRVHTFPTLCAVEGCSVEVVREGARCKPHAAQVNINPDQRRPGPRPGFVKPDSLAYAVRQLLVDGAPRTATQLNAALPGVRLVQVKNALNHERAEGRVAHVGRVPRMAGQRGPSEVLYAAVQNA